MSGWIEVPPFDGPILDIDFDDDRPLKPVKMIPAPPDDFDW